MSYMELPRRKHKGRVIVKNFLSINFEQILQKSHRDGKITSKLVINTFIGNALQEVVLRLVLQCMAE